VELSRWRQSVASVALGRATEKTDHRLSRIDAEARTSPIRADFLDSIGQNRRLLTMPWKMWSDSGRQISRLDCKGCMLVCL
jgi:hypothetical protein